MTHYKLPPEGSVLRILAERSISIPPEAAVDRRNKAGSRRTIGTRGSGSDFGKKKSLEFPNNAACGVARYSRDF
jgi:hypothetical protein